MFGGKFAGAGSPFTRKETAWFFFARGMSGETLTWGGGVSPTAILPEGNRYFMVVVEDLDVLGPGFIPESPSVNTDGLILG